MQIKRENIYIAIDLKSFYASVECRERGLDPMNTNLIVADSSRTEKTICLAVSPSLKQYGIPGRARLFEVVKKIKEVNTERRIKAPGHILKTKSYNNYELKEHREYEIDYTKMTLEQRSAQFAPFAALTGYDEKIKETSRLTSEKIELDDELKLELDNKL